MKHLTAEQLVDAAERRDAEPDDGVLSEHVSECARCRAAIDGLRATMSIVSEGRDDAEPSPLFWDHFSARVRDAVASPPQAGWRPRHMAWTLGAAIAAVAILLAVWLAPQRGRLSSGVDRAAGTPATSILAEGEPLGELPSDDSWQLIADLTPQMDWEAAGEAGIVPPDSSDHVLLSLSDAERDELRRLLATELSQTAMGS